MDYLNRRGFISTLLVAAFADRLGGGELAADVPLPATEVQEPDSVHGIHMDCWFTYNATGPRILSAYPKLNIEYGTLLANPPDPPAS